MDLESFLCQLVAWDKAVWLARDLAKIVKASGYRPDLVIAVGRGGFVPSRIVCDFLLLNELNQHKNRALVDSGPQTGCSQSEVSFGNKC